jgi:uncharacterized membrane protein YfcA
VTDPSAAQLALLGGAALGAGAVNAVAGGGSLISFPALLAVGYPSVTANVTNMIAVTPGYASGSTAYRAELRGQRGRIRDLGLTTALGTAVGTAILLLAPEGAFDAVVPFLVLLACALLAAQPLLARAVAARAPGGRGLHGGVFAAAIYGGYFGAGLGIMLLAVLGAFVVDDLQRLNALKGVLSLVVALVAGALVAVLGPVAWGPALLMAVANVAGGWIGARVARRLPAAALRWGIVVFGVAVAGVLLAS